MKTISYYALLGLLILGSACEKNAPEPICDLEIPPGARIFEFAHRSSEFKFRAWTSDPTVIAHVEAQLALAEDDRTQHINGEILEQAKECNLNPDWSWYFNPEDWDLADLSIEVCDGNPQYVEENLEDYLDIDRYCPWGSYVLREIDQP